MQITIGSISKSGDISKKLNNAASQAKHVVFQTDIFENIIDVPYTTLDDLYDSCEDFDELIEKSCERLMKEGTLFITLGDVVQNNTAIELSNRVLDAGGSVKVLPLGNVAISLAMEKGYYKKTSGVFTYTAASFDEVTNTDNVLIIDEIDSRTIASELKLKLSRFYDDEHPVLLADVKNMTAQEIMLFELDCSEQYGFFTSAVIRPVALENKKRYTFQDLILVMDKLRSPFGCPWDKQQTHQSLKRYLVEESYEVLEAIDENDINSLYDELGDVLLQVVFHAKIAQQHSEFDISDVTTAICEKMISRHTHIFGDAVAHTPGDVIKNWEVIKREEKSHETQTDVLKGVPKSMPALLRSGKVQHKAAHVGFDFKKASEAIDKLKEEVKEVESDIAEGNDLNEECGDLLFSAVNVVRLLGIEPETALQKATDKFINRFSFVEQLAKQNNTDMRTCGLETLDDLWNKAKELESNSSHS